MYVEPSAPPMPVPQQQLGQPYLAQPVIYSVQQPQYQQQQQQTVYYSAPYYIQSQPRPQIYLDDNRTTEAAASRGCFAGLLAGLCCCLLAAEIDD